jgi:hypothetical protein
VKIDNRHFIAALGVALALSTPVEAGPDPRDKDTSAWWKTIAHLSSDAMRGRDTGSSEHRRAAQDVATMFANAGLKPMGDDGTFLQSVPLHEVKVEPGKSRFEIIGPDGTARSLRFLHDISMRATTALPASIDAPLAFRGYCGRSEIAPDVAGKVLICFGGRRKGMVGSDERLAAAAAAGAAGVMVIDDVGYTLEQPTWFWPVAYARTITLPGATPPPAAALPVMRLHPDALPRLFVGSGQSAATILAEGTAARSLPGFDLPGRLRATITLSERQFTGENIIALLPGTDPTLADQHIVVDAHLDGYGIGTPVNGDAIYNGAFDDAAYVASLVQLARARANAGGFRRPVLFIVFTGEEKGLLGSRWFIAHPSVPLTSIAANITLDAIRPLFPLKILTLIGSDKSSLKTNVERVAGTMGIEVRPDLETVRGMIGRTDASPFLGAGIPAVAFMFGYDSESPEEAKFRTWYRTRYHKPQDDIGQPIDFRAAADFNKFFYGLTHDVADAPDRARMTP